MDAPKLRATLVEIFRRAIPLKKDGKDFILLNGDDNLYPYEIKGVIANSPTAKRAANLMAKFVSGQGLLDDSGNIISTKELPIINAQKGYNAYDLIRIAAPSLCEQGGVWFHVGYGINSEGEIAPNKWDVLDYCRPRKQNSDDEDYSGKVFVNEWCDKKQVAKKKKDCKWYYPFNNDVEVVKTQMQADAKKGTTLEQMIKSYRGQVFYLNTTPEYEYALSRFDAVYNDCDSEYRFGLYTNNELRTGFLGKVLVVTQGIDDEKAEDIKADMAEWLGAENSGSMYHLDVVKADDLDKVVKIEQLKPQYDDKLFVETDKRIRRNILGAANNIPEALVTASDSALFGTSADTYAEMIKFYSEQTKDERLLLENALYKIGLDVRIAPIFMETTTTNV